MNLRVIRPFFKVILAFVLAPVILLAWIMICTSEAKEFNETGDTYMENTQFALYTDLETLEVKETAN